VTLMPLMPSSSLLLTLAMVRSSFPISRRWY
jgi:hypothetical protein